MRALKRRRDPAPSRLVWRLERLWMIRRLRRAVLVWLPLGITCLALVALLRTEPVVAAMDTLERSANETILSHDAVAITALDVEGGSGTLVELIDAHVQTYLPASVLTLDLEVLRAEIEALGAVDRAALRVDAGGRLKVSVTERAPAALWQSEGALHLVDATGRRLGAAGPRATHAALPLLAGPGAPHHVAEAIAIMEAAAPFAERIRGLVRVGERRWDIELSGDATILLPQDGPVEAVLRIAALHRADDMLDRDIDVVDYRDAARPILRLSPHAVGQMRRLRETDFGEDA